jgi:hypothetical protein
MVLLPQRYGFTPVGSNHRQRVFRAVAIDCGTPI